MEPRFSFLSNLSKQIMIVGVIALVGILLILASIFYFSTTNTPIVTPPLPITPTPTYSDLYIPDPSASIDPELAYLADQLIKPFYEARLKENEQQASIYFGREDKNYLTEELSKKGWKFIDPSFQTFTLSFLQRITVKNRDTNEEYKKIVAIVKLNKQGDSYQTELLGIDEEKNPAKIYFLDYRNKDFSVVFYQNKPYLVLDAVINPYKTTQKALLTTNSFDSSCTPYVGTTCDIFLKENTVLTHAVETSDTGHEDYENYVFEWRTPTSLLLSNAFGEGGQWAASIRELNVVSKKETILLEERGEAGLSPDKEIFDPGPDGFCEGDIYEKNGHQIDFYSCQITLEQSDNPRDTIVVVFDKKIILKKEINGQDLSNSLNVSLRENALNGDMFTFSISGKPYQLSLNDGKLREL